MFIATTFLVPVVFFVSLEVMLRLVHYGPDLSLFTTETIRGRTYHIMNPGVKNRYFYSVQFNPSTGPDYFFVPKPAGTYRIFCLGGSTTVGYPYWYNASFSTFVRDRLRATFPGKPVEVINVGMTATNSFTALDMARDLMGYEPDLLLVYDGHNEFYGALGVASHESFRAPRWLTNLYLRAIHLRTILLLRQGIASAAGLFSTVQQTQPLGTMMEKLARGQFIPYGSATYRDGLETFRGNLEDLRDLCRSHGVPLILATQVSNLRDQPPFVSGEMPQPERRMALNEMINWGLTHYMEGNPDSALTTFRTALSFDSLRAETHYHVARCLDRMGDHHGAETEYIAARDYDQLRFRTSSDFNGIILSMEDGGGTFAVDMEQEFRASAPDSLIGKTLLFEHLHPRAYGYFLMGRAYARTMREHALCASAAEWEAADTVDETRLWNSRPVTTLDERTAIRRTEILISGWPFASQFPIVDAVNKNDTLGLITEKLTKGQIGWLDAHDEAAKFYLSRGQPDNAEGEYRAVLNQVPQLSVQAYLRLAKTLFDQHKTEEMGKVLRASMEIEPTILACRALGDIALNSRKAPEAIPFYEKMFTFPQSPPEQVENGVLLAQAYALAGRPDDARRELMKVLKLKPDHAGALRLLQSLPRPPGSPTPP